MVDVHFSHLQVVVDVPQGYSVSSMTVDAAASALSDVVVVAVAVVAWRTTWRYFG